MPIANLLAAGVPLSAAPRLETVCPAPARVLVGEDLVERMSGHAGRA